MNKKTKNKIYEQNRKTQVIRIGKEAAAQIKTEAVKYRRTSGQLATQIILWWLHTGQNQGKAEKAKNTPKNQVSDLVRRGR